jgi:hypothetical protein
MKSATRQSNLECDIYVQPYADDHNAGYILLDLAF